MQAFNKFVHIESEEAAYGLLDILASMGFDFYESAEYFGCDCYPCDEDGNEIELEDGVIPEIEKMIGKWYIHFEDDFDRTGDLKTRMILPLPDKGIESALHISTQCKEIWKEMDLIREPYEKGMAFIAQGQRGNKNFSWEAFDAAGFRETHDKMHKLSMKLDLLVGDLNPFFDYAEVAKEMNYEI